jgi:hypothetical protein
VVLILVVMTGVVAATSSLWHRTSAPPARGHGHSGGPPPSSPVVLSPGSADGFNETSANASMAIDNNRATAWDTQWYRGNPVFGGLKQGSGLILDMGKPVTLTSVDVQFGAIPGADVQIMLGNTARPQSQATVSSFSTVATATNVAGEHLFQVTSKASGRYVLIWFTKLPPMAGSEHKRPADARYQAKIFNIIVRGRG